MKIRLLPSFALLGSGSLCFAGALRWLSRVALVPCGLFALGGAVLVLSGCQSPVSSDVPGPSAVRSAAADAVVLGEGDVIRIAFAGAPELNNQQKIRSDGKISLALVGETRAAGLTVPQLQESLSTLYKPQLQNPAVLVTLDNSANAVIISGEVNSPGRRVFDKPTTLLEAIMEAGGFSGFANKKKVTLIRVEGGQYRTEVVDMSGALRGEETEVVYVRGGDIINVPE